MEMISVYVCFVQLNVIYLPIDGKLGLVDIVNC